jgi:hypothetical protein
MPLSSGHSRRAMVAAAAALAAPRATAGKKKSKKRPPLVVAVFSAVVILQGGDDIDFAAEGVWKHLPSGQRFGQGGTVSMPFPAVGKDLRAQLEATLKADIVSSLANEGIPGVSPDRIALTLL